MEADDSYTSQATVACEAVLTDQSLNADAAEKKWAWRRASITAFLVVVAVAMYFEQIRSPSNWPSTKAANGRDNNKTEIEGTECGA